MDNSSSSSAKLACDLRITTRRPTPANYDFIDAGSPLIFFFKLFAKRKITISCRVWLADGKENRSSSNRTRRRRRQTKTDRALRPNSRTSIASAKAFCFRASDWSVSWRRQPATRIATCWSKPWPRLTANLRLLNKLQVWDLFRKPPISMPPISKTEDALSNS
jgi:hypothetical protein